MAATRSRPAGKSKGRAKKKRRSGAEIKWIRAICLGLCALIVLSALAWQLSRLLEKRTYKLQYGAEIKEYSMEFGVDPYLVAAVIHCESSNRHTAVSRAGAKGLMQIMPDTGSWIAEKLGEEDFTEDKLLEPEVNIRFGCWYLKYLLDGFSGNRKNAVAAYNAGPGNVRKWLKDERYSQGGELYSIPFGETAQYVERVQRAYDKYAKLYADELG